MTERKKVTIDGNEAAAHVAFQTNEVFAIYPITPSSPMGEWADDWTAQKRKNIWGNVPSVIELQSEGGASATVHGSLQSGALTTTFTASQGLLLMIPNMFKIAGELTSTVFHITARTIATHALSIYGDHSDVMAARSTGWAMLVSNSVQEVMDFALISQAATLESRIPFIHFFDGFRTSHEVKKIEQLTTEDMRAMIDEDLVLAHRERALNPEHPVIRGTAQNPDTFFQGREASNLFYTKCPDIVQEQMDKFAKIVGRQYNLFDYYGAPDADKIIIIMGSGAEVVEEAIDYLSAKGEKVGLVKVRLYRPFSIDRFIDALPATTKSIAVLDRTKEAGSSEPLYLDIVNAISEKHISGDLKFSYPKIIGGRYGLSSKEFTPSMVKAIYDELAKEKPKNHFTIGINDDISNTSLEYDFSLSVEPKETVKCKFYGLGADGTVGANKNSIKIIGEGTDNFAQGYFVYDSKKSGSVTISHLRFGPKEIKSPYLIEKADFVACHQETFLTKVDMLKDAAVGSTFLLNTTTPKEEVWNILPEKVQHDLISKKMKFFVIDAYDVAKEVGLGVRTNTIMQTCFFAISNILPKDVAIEMIKKAITKSYKSKGEKILEMNFNAVDKSIENLHEVVIPAEATSLMQFDYAMPDSAPQFVKDVTSKIIAGEGDLLSVSQFPIDGTFPTGTTKYEKRNIAQDIPVWDSSICIQCNKCILVCPHAAIRANIYDESNLKDAPETFKAVKFKSKTLGENLMFTIQVAVEDCTGCTLCTDVCPSKNKEQPNMKALNMMPQKPLREEEMKNFEFFLNLPEFDRTKLNTSTVKESQFLTPLFEFSGACTACGETPYVKLLSQLFGDRALIANATGCSSIYGGNLPTTPWTTNKDGRGPSWSNSLFEDNAEFGLGFRVAVDKHEGHAKNLLMKLSSHLGEDLVKAIIEADQTGEVGIKEQRDRIVLLKEKIASLGDEFKDDAKQLSSVCDYLVKKSVWIVGGDGWAYDIGYGGLDHVLASGRNVNILVLDTEVYSNTGGQASKSTPRGAVARFASGGKETSKKDLGLIAMSYGNVYVGSICLGANDAHTVKVLNEAEAYNGTSIILAYAHCIAHGINMENGLEIQKAAVNSGHWMLYRFNPSLSEQGKNPLILDSKAPKISEKDFAYMQTRFKSLAKSKPEEAEALMKLAQQDTDNRWEFYQNFLELNEKTHVKKDAE